MHFLLLFLFFILYFKLISKPLIEKVKKGTISTYPKHIRKLLTRFQTLQSGIDYNQLLICHVSIFGQVVRK